MTWGDANIEECYAYMTMKQSDMEQKEIFTPKDLLNLQQLKTRQFLAQHSGNSKSKVETDGQTNTLDIPQYWQLLENGTVLHGWQKKCLKVWLDDNNGRGTVKVATGGGKTIFALAAATELQNNVESDLRLVIIVPTIVLMRQWYDELKSANLPVEAIGLMGGDNKYWRKQGQNYRILIAVINSAREHLPKFSKDNGWSKMLLVVDECHRANATEAQHIFESNPRYTLGLSATPEASEASDSTLPSEEAYRKSAIGRAIGPIIFDFSLKESLVAGLLTKFQIWHIGLALSSKENTQYQGLSREITDLKNKLKPIYEKSRSSQGFIPWCQTKSQSQDGIGNIASNFIHRTSARKLLLYGASARKEITIKILLATQEENKKKKTIVFHESIDQVNDIFLTALENKIPAILEHSKLSSAIRTDNIDAFRQNDETVIISAKSLIEGFNVPSADLGIIVASSGSVRQRIQSLGRMLRKKDDSVEALIIVLYVMDTTDEKIYEKADWDEVIGVDHNRYFQWKPGQTEMTTAFSWKSFIETLNETDSPPRAYLPKCHDIEENMLEKSGLYPARPDGADIKVDQNDNLRCANGIIKNRNKAVIDKILELNRYRHARRTHCGHLIVRNQANEWIYLGKVAQPKPAKARTKTVELIIKKVSGQRVIAKKSGIDTIFARNTEKATSNEAGRTHEHIITWIQKNERDKNTLIYRLFWDNNIKYWIELKGERIYYSGGSTILPLEFPE